MAGSASTSACLDTLLDSSKDCFAWDKFANYRENMGVAGNFNGQNRTLYIGRIKEIGPGVEPEEIVTRHFREWQHKAGGLLVAARDANDHWRKLYNER